MATSEKQKEPAGKTAKEAQKRAKPRTQRPKAQRMTATVVAIKTAELPEPTRSGVLELARAILRFVQHVWQEFTGAQAATPAPPQLLPGRPQEIAPSEAEQATHAPAAQVQTTAKDN